MSKTHSGKFYIDLALKNGLQVINGHGDHAKVIAPAGRGYMVVPLHRELAKGTECSIKRWFKLVGILLTVLAPLACLISGLLAQ